jgi:hypothetical protein
MQEQEALNRQFLTKSKQQQNQPATDEKQSPRNRESSCLEELNASLAGKERN